ncbi:MAG TPA: hypothetical protein VKY74_13865, partial [Chloroflexia bacterium]|nr:hypothetical protein [Chloroflexia bacterium]
IPPTPTPIPPTPTPIPPTPTPIPTAADGLGGPGTPASAADIGLINDAITKTTALDSYHFVMTLSVPGYVDSANIEGDYKSPNKAHVTIKAKGQTQEIINIANMSYVKNSDGSWTSSDLSSAAGSTGNDLGLGSLGAMAGGLDPTKATNIFGTLGRFAAGVNSASVIGDETVGGHSTKHYNVPLFLGNLMGTGGSTTPGESPLGSADVWIDPSSQLIQKMAVKLDLTDLMRGFQSLAPTPGPGQPSPTPFPPLVVDLKMDLSNVGQGPDITAPANVTPAPGGAPPAGPPPAATNTPGSSSSSTTAPDGSGGLLLQAAAQAMQHVTRFHFLMTSATAPTGPVTAEGDMVPPDKMALHLHMSPATPQTDLQLVKIGPANWMNLGGTWSRTAAPAGLSSPPDLTHGLGGVVSADDLGDSTLDGVAVHHLRLNGAPPEGLAAPADTMEVWVAQSTNYIVQLHVASPGTAGGAPGARSLTMQLSRFNDPTITVEAPQ